MLKVIYKTDSNSIDSNDSQIFNEFSEPSVKSKYLFSQRIQLNWVDAYTFCKANGLRLGRIPKEIDMNALFASLSIYFPLSDVEVIIDGSSFPEEIAASPCAVIAAKVGNMNRTMKNISCTGETFKFVCEEFDDDSEAFGATETFSEIDPGLAFVFKHIGDYGEFRMW